MLICRVEDVIVEDTITGSVVHFHWIRNINVSYSGVISVFGLGGDINSFSYKCASCFLFLVLVIKFWVHNLLSLHFFIKVLFQVSAIYY